MSETELWEAAAQLSFGENHDEDAFSSDIMRFGGLECVRLRLAAVCETQGMPLRFPVDSSQSANECSQTVHEGDTLYRLSSNLVLQVLHPKIDTLTNPTDGIFGPLESTSLGEVLPTPPITAAPTEDDDAASDTTAVATEAPLKIADKRFPTVSRGLGREGVGDGLGLSETIQLGECARASIRAIPDTGRRRRNAYKGCSRHPVKLSAALDRRAPSRRLFVSWHRAVLAAVADNYHAGSFAALEAQIAATSTSSALSSDYLPGRSNSSEGSGGSKGGAAAAAAKKKQLAKKGSRGVEMLKKASTQGMKPLSSFFTKAPTPAKRKSEA